MTVEQISNKALQMPTPMRAFVAEKLLASLDEEGPVELSEEWVTEIRQRVATIDKGRVQMTTADQLFSSTREKLRA